MFFDQTFIFYAILILCSKLKNVVLLSCEESPYFDVREFTHHYGIPKLNKLAINRDTGKVYIGAVNHLYQVSSNLKLQSNISTGPTFKFNSSGNQAKNNLKLQIDNYNKILVIDYYHSRLIACGNVPKGQCVIYSTGNDISLLNKNQIVELRNAIDADSSVVAVVNDVKNRHNPNFTLEVVKSHDYSAHSPINVPIYINLLRNVSFNGKLYEWETTTFHATAPSDMRTETYSITYVYGFFFKCNSYFLKIEERLTGQKSPYVSKLMQMYYHTDNNYQDINLAQIHIKCIAEGKHYDLVQAAHVGKPGSLLAESLNITPNDHVLFAIFSESQDQQGYSNKPRSRSALCVYSLEAINKHIMRKHCNSIIPKPEKDEININEICSETTSIMTFDILLTAINATKNGKYTDIFIGTNTGHIKKIIVNNVTAAYEQADIKIDEGSPVNSDLLLSPNRDHLYVMTEYRVTKISIKQFNCSMYSTYDHCMMSNGGTQYCGWCGSLNKCTMKYECDFPNYSSWIGYDFRNAVLILKSNLQKLWSNKAEELQLYVECPFLNRIIDTFYCNFSIENNTWTTTAFLHLHQKDYNIHCQTPNVTNFTSLQFRQHTLNVTLSISTNHIRDIATKTYSFFDCDMYASSKKCIFSTSPCYWCSNIHKCIYRVEKKMKCPNAPISEIISFWPLRGPKEGGTNITILGQNLSYPFNNTQCGIRVAGRSCMPQRNNGVAMKRIVCTIEESSSLQVLGGPVELHVNGQTLVTSQQNFTFANPEIESIHPVEGPTYGGTVLTITGKNFDIGSSIKVVIGEILCLIFSISTFEMKCITDSYSPSPTSSSNTTEKHPNIKISEVFVSCDNTFLKSGSFMYVKDSQSDDKGFNLVPKGIPSGGIEILIRNVSLSMTQELLFVVNHNGETFHSPCKIQNYSTKTLSCASPRISSVKNELLDPRNPRIMEYSLTNSESSSPLRDSIHDQMSEFLLYPDPEFHHFLNSSIKIDNKNYLIIRGNNINRACQKTDIIVRVGNDTICEVLSLSLEQVVCLLPKSEQNSFADEIEEDLLLKYHNITIVIGENFNRTVPKYTDSKSNEKDVTSSTAGLVLVVAVAFTGVVSSIIVYHFVYRKKILTKSLQRLKNMQRQMNQLELCVAAECKEAFTELQTQITTFTSENPCNSLPFHDYCRYTLKFLFPSLNDHFIILSGKPILIHKEKGLQLFDELILNKRFLLSFVRTLESDKNFSMNDRVYVASMIMITLEKDMSYCTDILKILMSDLIERNTRSNCHPKLLLRRTESVAEKMLSAWFSFLLHKFLRETAGYPMINLFSAIKQQINKGPVDIITSESRYCLSETKMIRKKIDYHSLTIFVNVSQQAASMIKLQSVEHKFQVNVLDCDTISQVKEKIVDVISPSLSYSQQPNLSEICLEWLTNKPDTIILSDDDHTSKVTGNWRQKNTLCHYGVPDGAAFHLISANEANHRTSHVTNYLSITHASELPSMLRVASKKSSLDTTSAQSNEACLKEWHLVEPFNPNDDPEIGNNQIVPEIYLTRLLAMKSSLQKFVDDLFGTIFKITHQNNCFPVAIKYMFDFLDDQALQHGITDPEVVHVWKNNCLPLRFWVNLIKNPDFLFDIHKSNPIDSCLSVIAQLLMDSCSTCELHLSKDSATSKLLYAKEIPLYKQWVEKYYADIKKMPKVSPQDMRAMLRVESQTHAVGFDMNVSTYELYKYAEKYKEKLITTLKGDELAQEDSLACKFQRVLETMSASWNS